MKAFIISALILLVGLHTTAAAQAKKPIPYSGTLIVGKTYRGKVNFGSAYGMTLTPMARVAYHHSVLYRWKNAKDFTELDPDKDFGVRMIVFKVTGKEIQPIRKNLWATTYELKILKVEEK